MTDAALATPDATQTVAANVRAEMSRAGLTQGQLARELGLTPMFVSRRLSGDVAMTPNDIELFAGHFGIDVAELFVKHPRRASGGARGPRALYLMDEVGLTGFEPMTSTVKSGRSGGEIIPLFGERIAS